MSKALLTFSNGETLELSEGQLITPVLKIVESDSIYASQDKSYEIWYHIHDGLIPSILEMLFSCEFFALLDDHSKVYNSKLVVTIKNI